MPHLPIEEQKWSIATRGGHYRGDTSPQHFGWGDAKVNIGCNIKQLCIHNWLNFLVIRHFFGSLQNAYLGEELNGFCIIKIQSFQLQGGLRPLTT